MKPEKTTRQKSANFLSNRLIHDVSKRLQQSGVHCSGILFLKTGLQKHRYVPDYAVWTLLSRFSGTGIIQKYFRDNV